MILFYDFVTKWWWCGVYWRKYSHLCKLIRYVSNGMVAHDCVPI